LITSFQVRAARALLGIDQKRFAALAGRSLPTIQWMEASEGKHAPSDDSGRGVRGLYLKEPGPPRLPGG
jgi:hypothetical protein